MTFDDYRLSHFKRWRKLIFRMCWYGIITVFLAEIMIFFFFRANNAITTTLKTYLALRIIIPSAINFTAGFLAFFLLTRKKFSENTKNTIVCYLASVICGTIATFHSYFTFLLVSSAIPIFVSTAFASSSLLKKMRNIMAFTFVVSSACLWFDKEYGDIIFKSTTIFCFCLFLILTYLMACGLEHSQMQQLMFIYESYKKQESLIHELKVEPLTQLYNRSALDTCVLSHFTKFKEGRLVPHMVIIDIDHFKQINDTYGHANGDEVLTKLSAIIKKNMNGIRHCFRFGGEEFVLMFEEEPKDAVLEKVQKIKDDFSSTRFEFAPDKSITFSAGIARPKLWFSEKDWFNEADKMLYRAKAEGRNRIEVQD